MWVFLNKDGLVIYQSTLCIFSRNTCGPFKIMAFILLSNKDEREKEEQKANPQKERPETKFCLAKQMAKQTRSRGHAPRVHSSGTEPHAPRRGLGTLLKSHTYCQVLKKWFCSSMIYYLFRIRDTDCLQAPCCRMQQAVTDSDC